MMVYPRVCGGTVAPQAISFPKFGLSPRVRGNPAGTWYAHSTGRSIPACAGEPVSGRRWAVSRRVYPRVCGGTPDSRLWPILCLGSIPACAGEPANPASEAEAEAVYPRVCGGTTFDGGESLMANGLSPRVRGNLRVEGYNPASVGSIPACAGEPMP